MGRLLIVLISVLMFSCKPEGRYYVDSEVIKGRISHIDEGIDNFKIRKYHEIYIQSPTKTEKIRLHPANEITWKVGDTVTLMINIYKENCNEKN